MAIDKILAWLILFLLGPGLWIWVVWRVLK